MWQPKDQIPRKIEFQIQEEQPKPPVQQSKRPLSEKRLRSLTTVHYKNNMTFELSEQYIARYGSEKPAFMRSPQTQFVDRDTAEIIALDYDLNSRTK